MVVAVDLESGTLVLENGDEYRHLPIDIAATIGDAVGNVLGAADLRAGDVIHYATELVARSWVATSITVAWTRVTDTLVPPSGARVAAAPALRQEPWRSSVAAVDEALARSDVTGADRAWHEAHGAALRSRDVARLIEVGDAALRIGDLAGRRQPYLAMARKAYRAALFRARSLRSLDGVLRAAEAFARLGDGDVVENAVRIAQSLIRNGDATAEARERLRILDARSKGRSLTSPGQTRVTAARGFSERGFVVAANCEEGTLVLQRGDEGRFLTVDFAASIRDVRGTSMTLCDLRPHDLVEYHAEWPGGRWLATELRVTRREIRPRVIGETPAVSP